MPFVAIYNASIPGRMATADLMPVSVAERRAWFEDFDPRRRPLWIFSRDEGSAPLGWLSVRSFYGRPAYAETVEVGVYIDPSAQRQGIGRQLLNHAIARAPALGISTLLTRDSDDYVALDERTARANAFQADLFLSIHCNASEDGAGRGVMTFVLDDSHDAASTRVAARENDASAEAAAELAGALSRGDGGLSSTRSNHFAELLQRSAIASLSPSYSDIPNSGINRRSTGNRTTSGYGSATAGPSGWRPAQLG